LKSFLKDRGWNVEQTHGNLYQTGFPDLYVAHSKWGQRWIDCKQPKRYSFTRDQKRKWPLWDTFGIGIWILTGANQAQYDVLFGPPNWRSYWKDSWGQIPDIDELLQQLCDEESSDD
jgi:hypothetical protein